MEEPSFSTEFDWSKPVPIVALLDMKFNIPTYQRGYRWTETHVNDLLNDIQNFIDSFNGKGIGTDDFYSLQPIVVKWNKEKVKWNLIDGQQRMTTIFLVIKYFNCMGSNEDLPQIEYETREKSKVYLNGLKVDSKNPDAEPVCFDSEKKLIHNDENIDFQYMSRAFATINKWFIGKGRSFNRNKFQEIFLHNTRVIWYELPDGEDETESFTRLNLGKIPLTNAELIKALFLNSSNFKNEQTSVNEVKLEQIKIAAEWDRIENTLCNDEFWLFIHENNYNKPNRIDFIFDLIEQGNALIIDLSKANLGNDENRTFRYFSEFFSQTKKDNCDYSITIKENWKKVKKYFQIFEEWFNDLEIYHYVGYITCMTELKELKVSNEIIKLISLWNQCEQIEDFIQKLKTYIKNNITKNINLDQQYEIDFVDSKGKTKHNPKKTKAKSIFLLHNVLTVINQNRKLKNKEEYDERVFYKFPFHLFKKESWDVEHIDSNTENPLDELKDQKEWIAYSFEEINPSSGNYESLKKEVKEFVCLDDKTKEDVFNPLFSKLQNEILEQVKSEGLHNNNLKNQIGNFTLLDSKTNRGYGNALFPTKRRWIIGKDQGTQYVVEYDEKYDKGYRINETKGQIAFVPPVTKQVFLKYYTAIPKDYMSWCKDDFDSYKQNMERLFKEEKFI